MTETGIFKFAKCPFFDHDRAGMLKPDRELFCIVCFFCVCVVFKLIYVSRAAFGMDASAVGEC